MFLLYLNNHNLGILCKFGDKYTKSQVDLFEFVWKYNYLNIKGIKNDSCN